MGGWQSDVWAGVLYAHVAWDQGAFLGGPR